MKIPRSYSSVDDKRNEKNVMVFGKVDVEQFQVEKVNNFHWAELGAVCLHGLAASYASFSCVCDQMVL